MSTSLDDMLTTDQVAELLAVKRETLELWRQKGKGPRFLKLSNRKQAAVRYARAEVKSWLEANTFASTSAYTAEDAK